MAASPAATILLPHLQAQIASAATSLAMAAPSLANSVGKTYETWVLFYLAERLNRAGHHVQGKDHSGANLTGTFRVRGGPGNIPSRLASGAQPSYFEVAGAFYHLELHNSVQHRGISGAKHEFDISVFEKPGADFIRHHGGGPYAGDSVCGLELKAYDSSTTIPKSFARAFVGAVLDTDPLAIVSASLGFSVAASRPWPFRPRYALLTTADISADALRYLKRYRVQGNVHVDPTSRRALGAIVSHIRKWL